MNKTILILAVFAATPAFAQSTASQPAQPPTANSQAAFAPAGPGLPGGPANPGLPAAPANSGLPGFANAPFATATNAMGRNGLTNQFGTNGFSTDLGPLLAVLQNDIQQVLPALAAYNATVASGAANESLTTTGAISGPVSPPPATSGANLSSASGVNFSKRLGVNSGVNLSSPAGGVPPASSNPSLAAGGPVGFGLSPTGTTNSSGFSPAFESSAVPNSLDQAGAARDTLRELLVLQTDIQRLLPLVNTFNASPNAPGLPPAVTNNFFPASPPLAGSTNQTQTLTPTGRR